MRIEAMGEEEARGPLSPCNQKNRSRIVWGKALPGPLTRPGRKGGRFHELEAPVLSGGSKNRCLILRPPNPVARYGPLVGLG